MSLLEGREALGAETLIHFKIDAPAVRSGDPDALDELGDDEHVRVTARFTPKTKHVWAIRSR